MAAGLFKFLSPLAMPGAAVEAPPQAAKINEMARRIFDDDVPGGAKFDGVAVARTRPAPTPVVPEWYRRGGKIDELLFDAGSIDWRDDDGGAPLKDPGSHGFGGAGGGGGHGPGSSARSEDRSKKGGATGLKRDKGGLAFQNGGALDRRPRADSGD